MTLYKENAQEHELKEQLDEQEADLEDILKQTINFALSQKGVSDYDRGRIAGICNAMEYAGFTVERIAEIKQNAMLGIKGDSK